jgi:hypothetical protein
VNEMPPPFHDAFFSSFQSAKLLLYSLWVVANLCDCRLDFLPTGTKIFAPMTRQFFVGNIDAVSSDFATRKCPQGFPSLTSWIDKR